MHMDAHVMRYSEYRCMSCVIVYMGACHEV